MQEKYSASQEVRGASVLAIVTLVLALVGLFTGGIASFIALITGHIEASHIAAGRSSPAGYGINLTGLIIAWITVILGLLSVLFFFSLFRSLVPFF